MILHSVFETDFGNFWAILSPFGLRDLQRGLVTARLTKNTFFNKHNMWFF